VWISSVPDQYLTVSLQARAAFLPRCQVMPTIPWRFIRGFENLASQEKPDGRFNGTLELGAQQPPSDSGINLPPLQPNLKLAPRVVRRSSKPVHLSSKRSKSGSELLRPWDGGVVYDLQYIRENLKPPRVEDMPYIESKDLFNDGVLYYPAALELPILERTCFSITKDTFTRPSNGQYMYQCEVTCFPKGGETIKSVGHGPSQVCCPYEPAKSWSSS
jgi:hypothetical protein